MPNKKPILDWLANVNESLDYQEKGTQIIVSDQEGSTALNGQVFDALKNQAIAAGMTIKVVIE